MDRFTLPQHQLCDTALLLAALQQCEWCAQRCAAHSGLHNDERHACAKAAHMASLAAAALFASLLLTLAVLLTWRRWALLGANFALRLLHRRGEGSGQGRALPTATFGPDGDL
jgi:hypothetical protein